jgi:uncharacterized membrane protein (UPF0127 family)
MLIRPRDRLAQCAGLPSRHSSTWRGHAKARAPVECIISRMRWIALLLLAAAAFGAACSDGNATESETLPTIAPSATPVLRTIQIHTDDISFDVEVADDPAERVRGLSGREVLPDNSGMLFVWDAQEVHTLWMKDMLIPLDMVWLDSAKTVVSIDENVPVQPGAPDSELVRYHPAAPALYAIEINAGAAARFAIEPGDTLVFDETTE